MNQPIIGLANLMRRAFACESLEPIAQELLSRIEANAADASALLDLATIAQLGGDPALGLEFQNKALACRQHFRLQDSADRDPLRILAIASRGLIMDNMPVEFLLEHTSIQLEVLYLGEGIAAPHQVPDHDVAIVAVCESDANQPLLAALDTIAAYWPRPILNAPRRIAQLSRDRLAKVLGRIPGLESVTSRRVDRQALETWSPSIDRPRLWDGDSQEWIVRPVNTHAGHGLARIKDAQELATYLCQNVADEYFVAPFVDYRSEDGKYRKYRIALIGEETYPVHMAISQHWMVHYLNADMLENPQHRQEEAAFMRDYRRAFGRRHGHTLNQIAKRIGLDYVVVDCAETAAGDLLLFEADNGAVVHSMDSDALFPYKVPAMQTIFRAMRRMLRERSQRAAHSLAA